MGIDSPKDWRKIPPDEQSDLQIVPAVPEIDHEDTITPGMRQEIIDNLPEEEDDKPKPPTYH
ncbi:MAG: hypothetical protein UY70_C0023G0004 [Candidatus Kaiserbacteria bacterium GW2011_GWB1_52_6]|uniref:Uncharacterized protein n=3 Tax=Candidatus Kaiseribacteriota TaxID=1752734 RepID=A0A0G1ZQD0_9BACT|nr:MAG: hypothetical protein UY67_C0009G0004 [Candidatus Kaiserbacteria bacterium GW2011_GWA2_52_12]KKW26469.1 MAG: hypothetical protein UY70_C0023G0004 [Candidatus Kaiserbacteria bacterium GW2011_GWB1_52_6]KKW30447.1 MAG: hypothetical protein UY74_C0041G0011 [Candidatus Kaiserbacteria bacterium GW2011_GWC2_52_8b]